MLKGRQLYSASGLASGGCVAAGDQSFIRHVSEARQI